MRIDAETLGLFALRVVLGILWLAFAWWAGPRRRFLRRDRHKQWAGPIARLYFLCLVALAVTCALSSFWE